MTDTGGEVAVNHNFATEAHFTTYSSLQSLPNVQSKMDSCVQGQQLYKATDGQSVVLTEQQQIMGTTQEGLTQLPQELAEEAEEPCIDIVINNVVSSFTTRCHLDLKRIAQQGANVMYRRENGMVSMKIRRPYTTASIWSSGKITCTGARSEEEAKVAARRFARTIQNLGYRVRFSNFRVVNVLGTCTLPFGIRITQFSREHKEDASYEPEIHPGVTYRIKPPNKATLKIFSTGSITVTAPSVHNVQLAIEHIFPLVHDYRMEKTEQMKKAHERAQERAHDKNGPMHMMPKSRKPPGSRYRPARHLDDSDEEDVQGSTDEEDDDFDSEESQD